MSAVLTSLGPTVTIAPGVSMPSINLGTCCGSEPKVGLDPWLSAGGTGIDTAWDYHDQVDIRSGLAKHPDIKRDQLFITTKVPAGFGNSTDCDPDPEITVRYVKENLVELGVDQVDLVLIHRPCQPAGSPRGPAKDPVASNKFDLQLEPQKARLLCCSRLWVMFVGTVRCGRAHRRCSR